MNDKNKINYKDIDNDGKPDGKGLDGLYDGVGYEKEPYSEKIKKIKKLKYKKIGTAQSIKLNLANGFRLVERLINKWLGYLAGNNESPIPMFSSGKSTIIYLIIIIVLIILLWVK